MTELRRNDIGLLILRLFMGGFMAWLHGWPKLNRVLQGQEVQFPDPLGLGSELSFYLIVGAELGLAILLVLGVLTRISALSLAFAMGVAAFVHHAGDPFAERELALLYLGGYLTLAITGPGDMNALKWLGIRQKSGWMAEVFR